MRAGSRVSGVGRSDSCLIGSGLRNSNINGLTFGSIGVGPKNFSENGTNFSKLCNGSSNFGPNWTGSGNSSTPGAGVGEIDFIGVGLGHSANGRSDISEFVTPKTKISMFCGLINGSNGFSALDYTYVAPFPPWFVTVVVGSSRIAMPFNILKGENPRSLCCCRKDENAPIHTGRPRASLERAEIVTPSPNYTEITRARPNLARFGSNPAGISKSSSQIARNARREAS
ncbi:hypothetical protein L484_015176 [Morus notabilis]|uniref:Uncharacterized protein n=1 Tax=Morus notabilis TaxID=981085 RepID=W9S318_9ROSA|nr:hypothetical protein L484_015176 [Morus notabilis]